MTPRIRVIVDAVELRDDLPLMLWCCTGTGWDSCGEGTADTIAAAADAGREHLRRCHLLPRLREALVTAPGYSRRCGIGRADCAAKHCDCAQTAAEAPEAPGDQAALKVAQVLDARPRTGDSSPLHRSHNEGIRR